MKIKSVLYSSMFLTLLLAGRANASDGSVIIDGVIGTAGCSLQASSYQNINWAIGDKSLTVLPAKGEVLSEPKGLASLNLTSCPPGITVAYLLEGEADPDQPELFKVADGVGQATGVGFKFDLGVPATGYAQIMPNTATEYYTSVQQGSSGNYAITGKTLRGSLIATGGATNFTGATGKLDTTLTYSLMYN